MTTAHAKRGSEKKRSEIPNKLFSWNNIKFGWSAHNFFFFFTLFKPLNSTTPSFSLFWKADSVFFRRITRLHSFLLLLCVCFFLCKILLLSIWWKKNFSLHNNEKKIAYLLWWCWAAEAAELSIYNLLRWRKEINPFVGKSVFLETTFFCCSVWFGSSAIARKILNSNKSRWKMAE